MWTTSSSWGRYQLQTELNQLGSHMIPASKLLKLKQIITPSMCHWNKLAHCNYRYQSIRRTITNSDRTEEAPADLLPEPESELMPHSILGESKKLIPLKKKKKSLVGQWHFYWMCFDYDLQNTDGTARWPMAADAPASPCCCSHPAPSFCAAPISSPCCIQTLSVHWALS